MEYVRLYECEALRARITPATCKANKQRLHHARTRFAGRYREETLSALEVLAPCESCPGCQALSRRAGKLPNVVALTPPEPTTQEPVRPKLQPREAECANPGCDKLFAVRGPKRFCSRQCNDAAKWQRRKARGITSNRTA